MNTEAHITPEGYVFPLLSEEAMEMKIKVINQVHVYEVDGDKTTGSNITPLQVSSHFIMSDEVILQYGDDLCITVAADDLKRAIDNATNSGR